MGYLSTIKSTSNIANMADLCQTCHSLFASFNWYDKNGERDTFPDHHRTPSQMWSSVDHGCRICVAIGETVDAEVKMGKRCDGKLKEYFTSCNMYPTENADGFLMNFYINYSNTGNQGLVQFKVIPALDDSLIYNVVSDSTDSEESFRFITENIENCNANHQTCSASTRTGWVPTRVLDLFPSPDSGVIQLVETKGNRDWATYATLSHCWGKIKLIQLLQSNISSMLGSISLDLLPNTFLDAIRIARTLGFRYLWIDSLCIIQDSKEDWQRESITMENVYKCSALNIAASDSADSSGGCFKRRNPRLLNQYSFTLKVNGFPRDHWLVEGSKWREFLEHAPLYNRAWVLQESLLAPRILHCSKRHLIWECKETVATEQFPRGIPQQFDQEQNLRIRKAVHETDPISAGVDLQSQEVAYKFNQSWNMIVMGYTSYGITKPSDKLIALAGIAASLKPILGEYYAGLWNRFLPSALMWHIQKEFGRPGRRAKPYRAPSWSWASVDGVVVVNPLYIDERDGEDGVYLPRGFPEHSAASVLDVQVQTRDSGGIGEVTSGFMDIRGRPVEVLLERGMRIRFERRSRLVRGHRKVEWDKDDNFKFTRYLDDEDFKEDNPPPLQLTFLPLFLFPPDVFPSRYAAGLLLQSDGDVFWRVGTLRVRGYIYHGTEEHVLRIV